MAKIADFGRSHDSRVSKQSDTLAHRGNVGTLLWSAPETLAGEDATTLSDVFSFGVVMWEALTLNEPPVGHQAPGRSLPLSPDAQPQAVVALQRRCCLHDASMRPSFREITPALSQVCECHLLSFCVL